MLHQTMMFTYYDIREAALPNPPRTNIDVRKALDLTAWPKACRANF